MTNIEDCNIEETKQQIEYLKRTPVFKCVPMLINGSLRLKKGIITSLKELGLLRTIFSDIELAKVPAGQDKFLVKDMMAALMGYNHTNEATFKTIMSIRYFMEQDKKKPLDLNITILHQNGNYMIIDGNKRTIAFYHNRININQDKIYFPAYLVVPN